MLQNAYVDSIYGTKITARAKSVFLFILRDEIEMAKQFSSTQCMHEFTQLDNDLINLLWDKNYVPKTYWLEKTKNSWTVRDHNGASESLTKHMKNFKRIKLLGF